MSIMEIDDHSFDILLNEAIERYMNKGFSYFEAERYASVMLSSCFVRTSHALQRETQSDHDDDKEGLTQ